MKVVFFAAVFLLAFVYKAECVIDAWTEPVISAADGSGTAGSTLAEHDDAGDTAITVAANNAVSYTILTQTPGSPGSFAVADDGTISFTGSLNFEQAPSYELVIEATEDASNIGTASITITITDEDDPPAFDELLYIVQMSNGAGQGSNVISLTATEEETGQSVVSYAISDVLGGTADTDFSVDSNGVITVANSVTLDRTTTAGYSLLLKAVDDDSDGATTGTTVVVIEVTASSDAVAIMSGMVVTMIAFLVARFL